MGSSRGCSPGMLRAGLADLLGEGAEPGLGRAAALEEIERARTADARATHGGEGGGEVEAALLHGGVYLLNEVGLVARIGGERRVTLAVGGVAYQIHKVR